MLHAELGVAGDKAGHEAKYINTTVMSPWCAGFMLLRALVSVAIVILGKLQYSVVSSMHRYRLYDSMTLTYMYFEIEHAQWKQHMALLGVVDRYGH